MSNLKKTELTISDRYDGVLQKLWIVGQPLERGVYMNFIGNALDVDNRNECRTSTLYSHPKYFASYEEARECAKYWNERVPWRYDSSRKVHRHEMACAFYPILVKIVAY